RLTARAAASGQRADPGLYLGAYRGAGDEFAGGFEDRREEDVRARVAGEGTHRVQRGGTGGRGGQRGAQLNAAYPGEQLDREQAGEVVQHGTQLAGGGPAHGYVVLLHPARGYRVHARRPGQSPVLRDDPGGRVLRDHQSGVDPRVRGEERRQVTGSAHVQEPVDPAFGDRADLRGRDREEVGGEAQWRAVEVAGRLDPTIREYHRVVHNGHQLAGVDSGDEVEGVPGRTGDLGSAAHRVRVLDGVGQVVPVTVHDGRPLEQPVDVGGRDRLAGMWPDRVQFRGERPVRAEHGLDGQCGGHVGHGEQVGGVALGEDEHAEHPVGTVDQRQPFLAGQRDRVQAGGVQRLGARDPGTVLAQHPALAHEYQRAVGQWGQVTGGTERAVLGYPRGDVVVEQVHQGLGDERAYPGVAQRQRPYPQQQHRADDLPGHRRADPGRVGTDERVLELGAPFGRDERTGERAEPGGDAVDRLLGKL